MPKSANQKLKLLYLMKYLLEKSDELHPLSVADMISELERYGVKAERKSIYDDLEALRVFGLDVVQVRGKTTGYYVGARDFELAELKLLVDSVQSSKFITHKKTLALIKKIESLASVYDAQLLQRQVFVRNRVKSMNESVYYNVDKISNAITADKVIKFRYFDYSVTKERRFRKDGEWYEISPFALLWDDENYYMLGFDSAMGIMKHYRVDKMTEIESLERFRDGKKDFEKVDMSEYSKKVFGMFTGEMQTVKLRFSNHLVGAVIDRFGRDTMIVASDEEHFTVSVNVAVSPKFYAWLFGFGTDVEIIGPASAREEMKKAAEEIAGLY
ncbi:MAG: WYL domain-containing protein [Bacillota bacterium]|nr:WYL domain-containing protein [Bacillota bacterium]